MDDHGPAQATDPTLQSTVPGTGRVCAAMVIMGPRVDMRMKNEMLVIDKPPSSNALAEKETISRARLLFV